MGRPADGLLHPVALVALAVLVVNDQLLKAAWPGFMTGKLSDVAGLIVAPLSLQGAWEVGQWVAGRWHGPTRTVLAVAILAVGLAFAAVQVWEPVTDAYRWTLVVAQWPFRALASSLAGAPSPSVVAVVATGDPEDLLALPALAITWWLGRRRIREARRVASDLPQPMWREAATQTALDIPGVEQADDLFEGIADEPDGEIRRVGGGRLGSQALLARHLRSAILRAMKLYFAGPLFTMPERTWNAEVTAALRAAGHEVFLPQEQEPGKDGPGIFATDVGGLDWADGVVAIMDGPDPDSGTAWEVGYSFRKKPIVLVRTDFRVLAGSAGDYNPMLTQAATIRIDLPAASTAQVIGAILDALGRIEAA